MYFQFKNLTFLVHYLLIYLKASRKKISNYDKLLEKGILNFVDVSQEDLKTEE